MCATCINHAFFKKSPVGVLFGLQSRCRYLSDMNAVVRAVDWHIEDLLGKLFVTSHVNMLAGSMQVFLMMMCNLKWGVFVFFGLWQTVALVFTVLLVPETRGVPIEKASFLAFPNLATSFAANRKERGSQ